VKRSHTHLSYYKTKEPIRETQSSPLPSTPNYRDQRKSKPAATLLLLISSLHFPRSCMDNIRSTDLNLISLPVCKFCDESGEVGDEEADTWIEGRIGGRRRLRLPQVGMLVWFSHHHRPQAPPRQCRPQAPRCHAPTSTTPKPLYRGNVPRVPWAASYGLKFWI
jgi:hypothetical protein